jgi:hypothetical protein
VHIGFAERQRGIAHELPFEPPVGEADRHSGRTPIAVTVCDAVRINQL